MSFYIEDRAVRAIFDMLLPLYERLFGETLMHGEDCRIYNDPSADCPRMLHTEPLTIRLAQPSTDYWAQTVAQLSHELCHYAMRQRHTDKHFWLSWYEEIVCEAVTLYALDFAAHNWESCSLSQLEPGFGYGIQGFLREILAENGTDDFRRCVREGRLAEFEQTVEQNRHAYYGERAALYQKIHWYPTDLRALCGYQAYLKADRVRLDFARWCAAEPQNRLLRLMRQLADG